MSVVWVFPGQGSQRKGMGAGVLERYPELCARADEILGYSVAELCDDPVRLRETRYAQPALFTVNALSFLARQDEGGRPDYLAGHSLGEYTALFAAGCFDFETGLALVKRRGELMSGAAGGTMAAVLGAEPEQLEELLAGTGVDIANYNSPEQVVLAGPKDELDSLSGRAPGKWVPLSVSVPSHSRYMEPAAAAFAEALDGVRIAEPRVPVISNVTARPYQAGEAADLLRRQICNPVRWLDGLRYLMGQGVRELEEIGPGDVLGKLWDVTRRHPVETPAARDSGGAFGSGVPARDSGIALGSAEFRADYRVRHAYLAGSMFKGIASADLVIRMGRAGLMGFFGAGGLTLDEIGQALDRIERALGPDGAYGVNLLYGFDEEGLERETVDLLLRRDVRHVEAAAYSRVTAPLVRYRYSGAHRDASGRPVAVRHVLAKVSRPEVASAFMRPAPRAVLDRLVREGALSAAEAEVAAELPVSADICVEADSAGHTDGRSPYALMPAIVRLRDEEMAAHGYGRRIRVGASGGIGSPEAAAAAFVLGADFIVTGSVNQCTPEAGTSDAVKDLLAGLDVQDTAYAPAGDMFELGAQVQVARKGTLFPARANKLYQLYRRHGSLEEIDEKTRRTIQDKFFRRSFDEVWEETRAFLAARRPGELARAERDPKHRMALVFRWYFVHTIRLALRGEAGREVDYQVHCGPAMGAFNRWVAGTELADWRARHVDVIADRLMEAAAGLLEARLRDLSKDG
ncbi:ACP S-malonyltransferase [Nonomuraea cavernae]|uniref:[acyl-carrier-protein] S-malonyltransferase n=1 Tax=Nonomuraea cavernae TaxID=2045107 RepID=A0A917ZB66_9ACTN|nr:ACP S-malonyltransferase [Nonomuraea cavernae]MCA2185607.1 ACP S-malonyltransferase [Nonomuraea cavernae]GGO78043.1 polyketide biosynthesis protein PksE [Nonomuraea cavernae]